MYAVTLSNMSEEVVTVDFRTVDGTAIAGTEYEPQKGTVVLEPGETTKTIQVPLLGDAATAVEAFGVELSDPVNATLAQTDDSSAVDAADPETRLSQAAPGSSVTRCPRRSS